MNKIILVLLLILSTSTFAAIISSSGTSTNEYKYNNKQEISQEQLKELIAHAESENAHAAYELFERYKYGKGIEKNLNEGAKWARIVEKHEPNIVDTLINTPEQLQKLKRRAETGDGFAAYTLAWRYEEGLGALIEKNWKEALEWYSVAADCGDYRGMMWMGRACRDGRVGIPIDQVAALEWFTKCYELPDNGRRNRERLAAVLEISGLYHNGDITLAADEVKAREWLDIAETIARKHKQAKHDLAIAYHDGKLVPLNRERAFKLFKEAATADWNWSKLRVAAACYAGHGTPVDLAMARQWVNQLKRYSSRDWSWDFAASANPTNKAAARDWYLEDLSAADELRRQYEQAYFLETAKGRTEEAFELYRQIIATKATHGTHSVIAKTLEHMLTFYSVPENDPAAKSYAIARAYLEQCRERGNAPGVGALEEARLLKKSVPELMALDELCSIHDQAVVEILKQDSTFRQAVADYENGEIDGAEFDYARMPAERRFHDDPDYKTARAKWRKAVVIRNTRVLEYLIDDFERRGEPMPVDWIAEKTMCRLTTPKVNEANVTESTK